MHKAITTDNAPKAIGPYSQAILAKGQNILFISGQIPLSPLSMKVESIDIKSQTRQALDNLFAILKAADLELNDIVKTTIYLKDMNDFSLVNEIYEEYFKSHKPARACVEVARLPRDVLVEIDAVAISK